MERVIISLPQVFDLPAVQNLKPELLAALSEGASVTLEAAAVDRVGTPGLQLLISAARAFGGGQQDILINEPSEALRTALSAAAIMLPTCLNSEARLLNA